MLQQAWKKQQPQVKMYRLQQLEEQELWDWGRPSSIINKLLLNLIDFNYGKLS